MKTLHLEAGRHLYGGPRQVLLLLDGLKKRGIDATLACATGSAIAAAAEDAGHNVITHELGGDLDISAVTFLTRTVQQLKPDLLHAHSRRGADFFGGLAATRARVPAILTRRVDNPDTPLIGTLKYLAYDRVVAISDAIHNQLAGQGVPAAKLRTIRSSIDAAACQPTWTRDQLLAEFSLEPSDQLVAVVAQLIPRKGHALLLEAWPLVRQRCPNARLLVFGAGPLDAELRARADEHAATEGSVTFAGFRPDLRQFLGRVDLLVHPAVREGLGVSLLEAQAAGVPVVALAAGGVPEAVSDAVTGLLVPPGDPPMLGEALADAVVTLLNDAELRHQFGVAATARIRADFSPDRMTDDYINLYREVLA
ncbi:MAG: glycosyltransferase family 4 protein [Gammaproteobacteria bacterium]